MKKYIPDFWVHIVGGPLDGRFTRLVGTGFLVIERGSRGRPRKRRYDFVKTPKGWYAQPRSGI